MGFETGLSMFKPGFLVLVVSLAFSRVIPASGQGRCEAIFDGEAQAKINVTISRLAELKIHLDLALGRGASAAHLSALRSAYEKKSQVFADYLRNHRLMTRAQLDT